MLDHGHYVPLLKAKDGEFNALRELPSHAGITPLIEIMPSGTVALSKRLRLGISKTARSWGADDRFFLDLVHVSTEPDLSINGTPVHPASHSFDLARTAGIKAVPVIATSRSSAFLTAIRDVAATDGRGVCIRLVTEDLRDVTALPGRLDTLLGAVGLPRGKSDLILDFRSSEGVEPAEVARVYGIGIARIPGLAEWRSLTVASAAFPASLAAPMDRGWNQRRRSDWQGWVRLITGTTKPSRLPSYGDYGISHPGLPPTGRAVTLAQLRYTCDDDFLIYKGFDVLDHIDGYDQFHAICDAMIHHAEYRTPAFSWGDRQIQIKATTTGDGGSSSTWRGFGLSHHFAMVSHQIASLP